MTITVSLAKNHGVRFLFPELLHRISSHDVDYFISHSTTAAVSQPLERIWSICFSQRLLANLEDEIFLKGGSIVTPQKFNQVLVIKILPRNYKIYFLGSLLFFWTIFLSCYYGVFPIRKPFKYVIGLV